MASNNNNQKKATSADKIMNAVMVVVVVAVLAVAVWAVTPKVKQGLENMKPLPDTTKVSGMAEYLDMSVDEFKTEFGLGEEVKGSTPMQEAITDDVYNALTLDKVAKLRGASYEQLMVDFGITDPTVTPETTMEAAMDFIPLKNYFGEENFESAKLQYGFDETVTMDTLYGAVKDIVEKGNAKSMADSVRMQGEMAAADAIAVSAENTEVTAE